MLTGEHQTGQGIIKINCRPLEQAELRRYDKNEKLQLLLLVTVTKGEQ